MIEKILERLEEERKTAYRTHEIFEQKVDLGRAFGVEKAIEIVQSVAQEYGDGWIPVKERLPEVGQKVLVLRTFANFCELFQIAAKSRIELNTFCLFSILLLFR